MTKQESAVLGTLTEKVTALAEDHATTKADVRHIKEDVNKVVHAIVGNGSPGLVLRMDRLEQRQTLRDKIAWWLTTTIGSVMIGALGSFIWNWF